MVSFMIWHVRCGAVRETRRIWSATLSACRVGDYAARSIASRERGDLAVATVLPFGTMGRSQMKTALTSATSSTKAELPEPGRVFASLGFIGDRLQPQRVTEILRITPSKSWRKGEVVRPGPRSPEIVTRTGTWWLSTEGLVCGQDLGAHLAFLVALIASEADGDRLARLQELMRDEGAVARVGCFWHGEAGAPSPAIPAFAIAAFNRLPAAIETDFDTD